MTKIEQAKQMAHEAHDSIKQVRKYTGEPYWVHTDQVAQIVTTAPGYTEDMVCAAHLHDVIEDVWPVNHRYSISEIEYTFGVSVSDLVLALTDVYIKESYPEMNRAKRKLAERKRLEKTSSEAKTIKLADLISNTHSIVEHDPDFARIYLREKFALLPILSDGSPKLLQDASIQTLQAFEKLGMKPPTLIG